MENFFLSFQICARVTTRKGELLNQTAKTIAQQARGRALLFGLPVAEAVAQSVAAESDNLSVLQSELLRRPAADSIALGPLQDLFDDPTIEEIWINRPDEIWVAIEGVNHRLSVALESIEIEEYVERMLRSSGRRIDRTVPFVDAALADGSRLHVVIPSVTRKFWSVNIRKFRSGSSTLEQLEGLGMLQPRQSRRLKTAMANRESVLVSGATQAGKTTLLTALLNELPIQERLVTVEDTFEINCEVSDWVAMQTRDATVDGAGAIELRRLVRESLRMRPSRIAVGEVRGAEALDLLLALNSGIPGYCTIHANSAAGAKAKMAALPLLAGSNVSSEFANNLANSAVDLIVHCERSSNGFRRVVEILEVNDGD